MPSPAQRFRDLLSRGDLIVAPGVYDGYSARLVEAAGFDMAATSGAAVSNSLLGVDDIGVAEAIDPELAKLLAQLGELDAPAGDVEDGNVAAMAVHDHQALHAGAVGAVNGVGGDSKVLEEKLGRIGVVGVDAADFCRGDDRDNHHQVGADRRDVRARVGLREHHRAAPVLLEHRVHVELLLLVGAELLDDRRDERAGV